MFENHTRSYNVEILNSFNTQQQLTSTEPTINNKLKNLLIEFRRFEFIITLVLELKKKKEKKKTIKKS